MAPITNKNYNNFPYFPLPPPHHPTVLPPTQFPRPPNPPNYSFQPPPHNPTLPPPPATPPPSPYHPITPPRPFPVPGTPPPVPKPATPPPPYHPITPPSPFPVPGTPPPVPMPATPPPPPHHPIRPPPPPFHPSSPPNHPPPPSPSPSPGHHSTVIVIFVSLGGLYFLAFLFVALCCFIKKRKKKSIQKTEILDFDEHMKVEEEIVPGPHGEKKMKVVTIEEDVHIAERIKKNEKLNKGSSSHDPYLNASDFEASPSHSDHHHLQHQV